jgi:hypothetical protein
LAALVCIASRYRKSSDQKIREGTGWTFHGHEFLGSKMVKTLFQRLKLPLGPDMKYVQKMVKLSSRPIALITDDASDSALRRLLFDAGENMEDLLPFVKPILPPKILKNRRNSRKILNMLLLKLKKWKKKIR